MLLASALATLQIASASRSYGNGTGGVLRHAPMPRAHLCTRPNGTASAFEVTGNSVVPTLPRNRVHGYSCISTLSMMHRRAKKQLAYIREAMNNDCFKLFEVYFAEAGNEDTETCNAELVALKDNIDELSWVGQDAKGEFEEIYLRESSELLRSIDGFNEENALFFKSEESGGRSSLQEFMAANSSDYVCVLQNCANLCVDFCDQTDAFIAVLKTSFIAVIARRIKYGTLNMTKKIRYEAFDYIKDREAKFKREYDSVCSQIDSECRMLRQLKMALTRFNQQQSQRP